MKVAEAVLIASIAVSLSGCFGRRPQTAKAAPVPPRPATTAPAPPPEPLSVPQTNVHLPPPQPLSPEAIATTQPPGEPAPAAPMPPRPTPSRGSTRPVTPPRVEPPPAPAAPPVTPPAAEPERAPVSEVLPAAELKRLQEEAGARIQETRRLMGEISRGRLRQQAATVKRVESFLKQAEDAERRGDMRQSSELAGRALVLARELKK